MNIPEKNDHVSVGSNICDFIEIIDYDSKKYNEYTMQIEKGHSLASLGNISKDTARWINIDGQCAEEVLKEIGGIFNIHPLVMKNIRNSTQRTKIEEYRDFLYIVAKMIYYSGDELVVEHMNFILGHDFVISIGETKGDVFDNIRSRIRNEGTQIRGFGADYLMYSLLDAIVDGYFDVLEVLNEKIDTLEEQVMTGASQEHLHAIREIKKNLLIMNRCIWPLRDVTSLLGKESAALIHPSTEPYIRDVYDHIIQVIETTDVSRELLTGIAELHLSNTSYKLNEIMKILTIISTIFIPLTFIVGIYGMNFKYSPKIGFRWGYEITCAVMIVL